MITSFTTAPPTSRAGGRRSDFREMSGSRPSHHLIPVPVWGCIAWRWRFQCSL